MAKVVSIEAARNRRAITGSTVEGEGWPRPTEDTLREADMMREYLAPEDWRAWCLGRGLEVFATYTAVLPGEGHDEGDG